MFEVDLLTRICPDCRNLNDEDDESEVYVSILDEPSSNAPAVAIDLVNIGMALMIGGIVVALGFSFIYDTSVESADMKVNNFGKLSTQSNGIVISMSIAIIGSIFYVGGRLEEKQTNKS